MRADDLIQQVTNDLITAIEAGTDSWQMPWHAIATTTQPRSIDDRPYRGLNTVILAFTAAEHGWTSGVFGTYRSWQRHGAQVRRGERATHVLLWKPTQPAPNSDSPNDNATRGDSDAELNTRRGLIARTFAVFAAEQVDGTSLTQPDTDHAEQRDSASRIETADNYFATIGADVRIGGNRACYIPADDRILIPHLSQFDQVAHFYSTLAHEHIHRTGHPSRMIRDLTGRFGDDAYAVEELIAELGAAFWCAQSNLSPATRVDHAAYLAHWTRVLRQHPRVLVAVASRAQAALDNLNQHANHTTNAGNDNDPGEDDRDSRRGAEVVVA
jgi:antirestriction protein ArdC